MKLFSKNKMIIGAPVIIVLCIALYAFLTKPAIETHTWELFTAQQAEPMLTIAHHHNYTFDDDPLFVASKPIELTCVAKNGKLTITDKTNNKTYSGAYEVKSRNIFSLQRYEVVIEGKKGTANISSRFNRTLFISVDGYYLNFVIK
ncbi:MAG: hypothetical protein IJZ75_00585 [Clostridia bacterium]|nr:hypothetical protein [Clostridia bacterium]